MLPKNEKIKPTTKPTFKLSMLGKTDPTKNIPKTTIKSNKLLNKANIDQTLTLFSFELFILIADVIKIIPENKINNHKLIVIIEAINIV